MSDEKSVSCWSDVSTEIYTPIPLKEFASAVSPTVFKTNCWVVPRRVLKRIDFAGVQSGTVLTLRHTKVQLVVYSEEEAEHSSLLASLSAPIKRKKPANPEATCNCQRTKCLKLYCDCFAAGNYCADCACVDCRNDDAHEEERSKAMDTIVQRNPYAFRSKAKVVGSGSSKATVHLRGCNCTKSACLKKYCECFTLGAKCSSKCRCSGCLN